VLARSGICSTLLFFLNMGPLFTSRTCLAVRAGRLTPPSPLFGSRRKGGRVFFFFFFPASATLPQGRLKVPTRSSFPVRTTEKAQLIAISLALFFFFLV